ncbi:MAG TPA: SMP-30/gluconolactonase/LRE family protein, partial [Gemmatimonadales bacterium]|nr:SMP-30/gluconolactonase/LRE family protein [Gemmatimonadales bacterium]
MLRLTLALAAVALSACHPSPSAGSTDEPASLDTHRLPTGVTLDPAGRSSEIGSFPLALVATPGGDRVVALLNGHREQGIQVIEVSTGRVVQTISQPAAFVGLDFDHAGRRLYVSGGNGDVIYRYDWRQGEATLVDSLILATRQPKADGTRYPAGLAISPDDRFLYVAENLADSLAVIDLESGRVVQRVAAGRYPYGVAVAPDGRVCVSAWGGYEVRAFRPRDGRLELSGTIRVGRHPSALLLNSTGTRLFVASASTDRIAVVDLAKAQVITQLFDTVPGGTGEGSTPNALALSPDGRRLLIAEADNNAVAMFELSGETAGISSGAPADHLIGRIPVEWYPTALLVQHDTLLVANAKGRRTGPNPLGPEPGIRSKDPRGYTLDQTSGT